MHCHFHSTFSSSLHFLKSTETVHRLRVIARPLPNSQCVGAQHVPSNHMLIRWCNVWTERQLRRILATRRQRNCSRKFVQCPCPCPFLGWSVEVVGARSNGKLIHHERDLMVLHSDLRSPIGATLWQGDLMLNTKRQSTVTHTQQCTTVVKMLTAMM